MEGEVVVEAGAQPPADSVHRFAIEQGMYPFCFMEFKMPVGPCAGREEWSEHIFSHKMYMLWLRQARVVRAMRPSRKLKVSRNTSGLELLVLRWCSATHTFVAKWGEFTPTLEDVAQLLGLHVMGRGYTVPLTMDEAEKGIMTALEEGLEKTKSYGSFFNAKGAKREERAEGAKKCTTGAWIRYWFKDLQPSFKGDKSELPFVDGDKIGHLAELAAYVLCWLSKYIFPGTPDDAPLSRWCLIAVKIASGIAIPLGPLFLGTLYHLLDMIAEDSTRSTGRYLMVSYVASGFLQMFLYERFPAYGPLPLELNDHRARGRCWSGQMCRRPFGEVIDSEREFGFRPYREEITRVADMGICWEDSRVITPRQESGDADEQNFALVVLPGHLPGRFELGDVSKVYNPRLVPRQFGYNQGVQATVAQKKYMMNLTKSYSG
ncbi:uncharacterized protein LOC132278267 [Cornus florida]|uniref:uncharacterized protein LOC132278267 n=1 Tax=Cornus florida TaxID=4283 RepID=UPI00289D04A7|nr:uncharacterized protein LOC132278267 [Cornus florida]